MSSTVFMSREAGWEMGKEMVEVQTMKSGIGLFEVTHISRNHEISLGGTKVAYPF